MNWKIHIFIGVVYKKTTTKNNLICHLHLYLLRCNLLDIWSDATWTHLWSKLILVSSSNCCLHVTVLFALNRLSVYWSSPLLLFDMHCLPTQNKSNHYLYKVQCERIVIYISYHFNMASMHFECSSQGVLHFLHWL